MRRAKKTPKTALVLSGGGSRGAVEVGMLKILHEKLVPDVLIGTSVGAINAAMYAGGLSPAEIEEQWQHITGRRVFPFNWQILYLYGRILSLSHPFGLKKILRKALPVKTFEECRIPLHINATDLASGTSHFFSSGNLIDAILASSAIPPYYPPYAVDGRKYIDGGVTNVIAIEEAARLGCRQVIAIGTYGGEDPAKIWNIFRLSSYALGLVIKSKFENEVALESRSFPAKNVVLVNPAIPKHIGMTDFSHTKELILVGEETMRKALPKIRF